jgi:hypothetical protein
MSLLTRLKERKLVQWALAYAAGAWALLEGVDLVGGQFSWPTRHRAESLAPLWIGLRASPELCRVGPNERPRVADRTQG